MSRDKAREIAQAHTDEYNKFLVSRNETDAALALQRYERFVAILGYDPLA
jgi:hypothetical protein